MKLNSILGCALVTGLMAFASNNAQAKDLVISNTVYAPLNLKLETQYADGNKLKKASITTKQYLKDLGYNSNVILAVNTDTREIWLVNGSTLVSNLSSNGALTLTISTFQQVQPKESKQSYEQTGLIHFVSDSTDSFDVSGTYFRKYSRTDTKNGEFTYSDDFQMSSLSGPGFFPGLTDSEVPVDGSADFKGKGKIAVVE